MNTIERLREIIDKSRNIVFFTGAGVSTESRIPDFRGADGLSQQANAYPVEVMLSHDFFFHHTEEFYRFYKEKMVYLDALPNAAHLKMAELERAKKAIAVVTQNIDGLHQLAGSRNVLELHGSVHRNYCVACHRFYDVKHVLNSKEVPICVCGGIIKPDVVLYGEGLDNKILTTAIQAIAQADCLIVAGTSLSVYPASGLIDYFQGNHLVLINKTETARDGAADLVIRDAVGKTLGQV